MEKIIYMILLAIHNLGVVGCVAGPFYMARIVKRRSKYEKKLIYSMDGLMEDVITTQPPVCWLSLIALVATGLGFPAGHLLFHGTLRPLTAIGWTALILKLTCVAGMAAILYYGTFVFNPRLKEMFGGFKPDETPDPDLEQKFFALRARRKYWCDRCWNLGVLVLIFSAVLRWS
jgi:hypothetical protein